MDVRSLRCDHKTSSIACFVSLQVFYDLAYQPRVSNIRFADADGEKGKIGGCVVWDAEGTNSTCLTHHEIWFRADPSYQNAGYLQYLGRVNITETTFSLPLGTINPLVTANHPATIWYVVVKSGFSNAKLANMTVEQSTAHPDASRLFTTNFRGDLDWPMSWTLDLEIQERNTDLIHDNLLAHQYPFPSARPRVDYNDIINSGIGLSYSWGLISTGTQQILMTEALLKHKYIWNITVGEPALPPAIPGEVRPIPIDPIADQCIVGALFDPPACWSHAHSSHLEYWRIPPERRVECSVGMSGLNTLILDVMWTCRHCTMEVTSPATANAGGASFGGPGNDAEVVKAKGGCIISERQYCSDRTISFDVTPPPILRGLEEVNGVGASLESKRGPTDDHGVKHPDLERRKPRRERGNRPMAHNFHGHAGGFRRPESELEL